MSRLGKLPIQIPADVKINIDKNIITVSGKNGELKQKLHSDIIIDIKENEIIVKVKNPEDKKQNSLWGLFRALINNMVIGVGAGYEKKLEIKGVGYKAAVNGNKLNLSLGFSHPVEFVLPVGISANVEGNTISIKGADKQLVGEVSAQIRKYRKPEPYKGKGIRYSNEVIRRKAGKAAAK
jgi:large subunit ribosomal protein L6